MLSFLALGFLIGLRHALEPDHVAAVVSLSTRGGTLQDHARGGAWWGLGHAATLLLFAGTCVVFGLVIPGRLRVALEVAVGVMLVWLGVSVLVRLRRSGVHVHGHVHDDGTTHLHAHAHAPGGEHVHASGESHESHEHAHARPVPRTVLVGAMHGLAGSSALVLLVGTTAPSPAVGLAYVALFGLGAVVGMMLLAATVALPLRISAARRTGPYRALCAGIGGLSVIVGAHLVWVTAFANASTG